MGVPSPALIAIATLLLGHLLLQYTVLGRYIYAIGSNATAALHSGVNVSLQTLLIYTLTGTTAGIAAVCSDCLGQCGSTVGSIGLRTPVIGSRCRGRSRIDRGNWRYAQHILRSSHSGNVVELVQHDWCVVFYANSGNWCGDCRCRCA
ncbi:MAG: hypothetical protein HC772_06290 [Leptolyngbyaceae cyanobacterium CRU_2_3]|nr:hypothetical protein [Leptolyngbyaceae cyanobacterium CRU_2_3]